MTKPFTAVDLFAGAGGWTTGASRAWRLRAHHHRLERGEVGLHGRAGHPHHGVSRGRACALRGALPHSVLREHQGGRGASIGRSAPSPRKTATPSSTALACG